MKGRWFWKLFWTWALSVSIRVKVMGIALGLITLLAISVIPQIRRTFIVNLEKQLEQRGISIARDVAARSEEMILMNNLFALNELVRETLENNEDVRYVFILDRSDYLLAHTIEGVFPSSLVAANYVKAGDRFHIEELQSDEGFIKDIAVPIFDGRIGIARVGMSEIQLRQRAATVTWYLFIMVGIAYFVGVIAAYLLTVVLTRPIRELVEVAKAVGEGNFQKRAKVWADDEIGRLSEAFNSMTENLFKYQKELQHKEQMRIQLLDKLITVQEEERKRVARELHDGTGQTLTSLTLGLKVLESASDIEEVHLRSKELGAIAAEAIQELHDISLELRPRALDDLGLVAALERYVKEFSQKFNIAMDYQVVGLEKKRLSPQVETALYRIAQEALTNVVKHASAKNISVLLEERGSSVLVIIEDDGIGFDVEQVMNSDTIEQKLGVFGMQERASLLGGTLTVESTPKLGTTVFAEIPIDRKEELK